MENEKKLSEVRDLDEAADLMETAEVETAVQSPNIALAAGARALKEINAQGVSIELPDDQSRPFFHEQAKYILKQFPQLYKPVTDKG